MGGCCRERNGGKGAELEEKRVMSLVKHWMRGKLSDARFFLVYLSIFFFPFYFFISFNIYYAIHQQYTVYLYMYIYLYIRVCIHTYTWMYLFTSVVLYRVYTLQGIYFNVTGRKRFLLFLKKEKKKKKREKSEFTMFEQKRLFFLSPLHLRDTKIENRKTVKSPSFKF